VQGDAVATVLSFDGITVPCWLGDELPPDEPDDDDETVQGGTIRVVTLLFAGTTSWFCCPELPPLEPPLDPPLELLALDAPPGVSRTVLDGGGVLDELEPPLEPPLEPELLWHGWIAMVSVSELGGIVTSFEPGGDLVLPDCATCASEHGGTTMVSAVCCLATSTSRTPGFCNAVETASVLELDELDPQPDAPTAIATNPISRLREPIPTIICPPVASFWRVPDEGARKRSPEQNRR
jgi:hypothetical protein